MHAGVAWEVRRQAGSAGICAAHGAQQGKDERYLVHLNCCSETEKAKGYCLIQNLGSSYCFGLSHPNLGHKANFANEAPPGKKKQIQRPTINEEQSCVVGLFMRGGSWRLAARAGDVELAQASCVSKRPQHNNTSQTKLTSHQFRLRTVPLQ